MKIVKSQKAKIIIRILAVVVGISLVTFFIDSTLADHNLGPVFSVPNANMNDGGSACYMGLGYQIIRWNVLVYPRGHNVGVEKHYLMGISLDPQKPNVSLTYKNE